MGQHDPGLKYERSAVLSEAQIAAWPGVLQLTRLELGRAMVELPGVLLWSESVRDGRLIITATKYPPEVAERVIARLRRAALGGEGREG